MKRNSKLMRASGILLVLTLITSCFVGGTFAKYVTNGNITVTARVAKWGVTVSAPEPANQGFYKEYETDETSSDIKDALGTGSDTNAGTNGKKISVKSGDTIGGIGNVVAPGTKGTFAGVKIEADSPEVAYQVKTTADVTIENWEVSSDKFYCPLQFTVCDTEINGLDYDDANLLANAIESAVLEDTTYSNFVKQAGTGYHPNENQYAGRFSWEWKFEDTTSTDGDNNQSDVKDTELGQLLADNDDTNDPKISIIVTTTVTQID